MDCDKNAPVFRTLAPKQRLTGRVTFVLPATVKTGRYELLGRAALRVRGQAKLVHLRSMSQSITLRWLTK